MKRACQIVLVIVGLALLVSLMGCSKEVPASHQAADNAVSIVDTIYNSLPEECKTNVNQTLTIVAKREIHTINDRCDEEKEKIEWQKLRWKIATFGLLGLIGLFIARKILK